MRVLPLTTACLLAVALAAAEAHAAPPHWAQWRGPDGQGIASDANVPLEWSPTKNVLWKQAIPGRGHSSPVGSTIAICWSVGVLTMQAIERPSGLATGAETRPEK